MPERNIGASVRARLLNLAKETSQPHELLLTRYALERLLYRLSTTKHRDRFVLKGAMLMTARSTVCAPPGVSAWLRGGSSEAR